MASPAISNQFRARGIRRQYGISSSNVSTGSCGPQAELSGSQQVLSDNSYVKEGLHWLLVKFSGTSIPTGTCLKVTPAGATDEESDLIDLSGTQTSEVLFGDTMVRTVTGLVVIPFQFNKFNNSIGKLSVWNNTGASITVPAITLALSQGVSY